MDWRGKKVAVVGMGLSNVPLARYLVSKGARITAFDKKTARDLGGIFDEMTRLGVEFSTGPGYLDRLSGFEHVFLTPGMKKDLPEITAARDAGAEISSETRLFFQLCKATTAGVTGSAGKTTTTTLLGKMLKKHGRRPVFVGGNIGNPLIEEVERIPPEAVVVLELSSFQLQTLDRSPDVAVITNVSPNHLDVHASMEEYVESKKSIFRFQGETGAAVLNADNAVTAAMAAECPGHTLLFSRVGPGRGGAFVREDIVMTPVFGWSDAPSPGEGQALRAVPAVEPRFEPVLPVNEIRIPGLHNVENVLAAATASSWLGARPGDIAGVARAFPGVEHRLELVRIRDGVHYYNDSIATAPDRTIAALHTIEGPLVLILGGYDKHLPFEALANEVVERARLVFTLGDTAPRIEEAIARAAEQAGHGPEVIRCGSLGEVVRKAVENARPGDSVLLSPACASYDMFRNFEERGRIFKALVAKI
ncbi:MAG: UDP-N-acetylmuramoyl-L-alanine--D-glutamate ligase [Firmicutes bacterium]|nr:UDP-N-acetylmuramoyl-L-alanine--D-glutamate ligase [Bacillota bacterium]